METQLYVGNLSFETSEEDLRALFSQVGTVASVVLIRERDTGRSKGFAFVEMGSPAEAEQAMRMLNGTSLDGRALKVEWARSQWEQPISGNGGRSNREDSGDRDRRSGPRR